MLLALLIMSAVLATSFAVAAVLFAEVRSLGDLTRTEPVIYAAQAVTEESFFQERRSVPATGIQLTQKLGNIDLTTATTSLTDPIYLDRVSAVSTSIANTKSRYPLYDPNQPYGGLDQVTGLPVGQSDYGRVQVTHVDTGTGVTLHVYVCQFDLRATDVDCNTPSSPNMIYRDVIITEGNATPLMSLDPTLQQEVIVYGDGTNDSYIQVTAFGGPPYAPKGIPFYGQTTVNVSASTTDINRRLRIRVPSR
jgi:hypothetical protein